MRARLIFPFWVGIAQLDTSLTALGGGQDKEFGETRVRLTGGQRVSARREKEPILVRAQIEDNVMNALHMFNAGNSPEAKIAIVLDYHDLRRRALLNAQTGEPLLNVNDRMDAIYDGRRELVQRIRTPPGLYAIEVRPISFGLGRRLNLLLMRFEDREQSAAV